MLVYANIMKFLLSVLVFLSQISSANWVIYGERMIGSASIEYVKGAEGEKDVKSLIEVMKKSGQLSRLQCVVWPKFYKDDYQERLQSALLKVSPKEMKKIHASTNLDLRFRERKPWSYYDELRKDLKAAYLELEEFKDLESELQKVGYKLGHVCSEKFAYTDFYKLGEFILSGFHPKTRLLPYREGEDYSKAKDVYPSFSGQEVKGDKHYMSFEMSKLREDVFVKGKWSSSIEGYVISEAKFHQHDGRGWNIVSEVDHEISHELKFKKGKRFRLYIELEEKLKPVNTMVELNMGGEKKYFHLKLLKSK